MALDEMKCKECGTTFYGLAGRDVFCHICKTIILFRKAFGLEDLTVEEIDFHRIRDPKFSDYCKVDWRDFIPEVVRGMWMEIPFEARALAVMFAEKEARK